MKLPNEGTDGLTRDGFDWITLNVMFKVQRVSKCFFLCLQLFSNFLKNGMKTFLYILRIQLLVDDIDLSRDGCDWIIQKVIFKVGKVRFGPFSHDYLYYAVVTKCCRILYVASLVWSESWLKYERSEVTQQVIFNVKNFQVWPLWYTWTNIFETVHAMTNVSIKHLLYIYEKLIISHNWPFSLPDKVWHWMTLKGQIKVIEFLAGCFS